ncbi:MAG: hypothetical protein JXA21_30265 [Anaerolineae bacterium]|nr:hypothetical protein [Anaerolineae bacterium]
MKNSPWMLVACLSFALAFSGCKNTPNTTAEAFPPPPTAKSTEIAVELPVIPIPLDGPASKQQAEISSMDWYGDWLVLMPQYPARFKNDLSSASVFAISKQEILDFVDGHTDQLLRPREIPFWDGDTNKTLDGFEGYEAIVFVGQEVFLTIETSPGKGMLGYLIKGTVTGNLQDIQLDPQKIVEIQPQADIGNFSDETLVVADGVLVTAYEANGANVNPHPQAHRFELDLETLAAISFPTLEYRVTDATSVDAAGNFWVINYFWSGDEKKLDPARDELIATYGQGPTHARFGNVERLVELHYSPEGITLTQTPPIQLELIESDARNWEGIVRLDDQGFLLVTDTHPETMLAFVPMPAP